MSRLMSAHQGLIRDLDTASRNAARRNKPTMWAYYAAMSDWLRSLSHYGEDELRVILAGYSRVDPVEMTVEPLSAARRWAQGIYARRLLRAEGTRVPRPSLDWLRAATS